MQLVRGLVKLHCYDCLLLNVFSDLISTLTWNNLGSFIYPYLRSILCV